MADDWRALGVHRLVVVTLGDDDIGLGSDERKG